MDAIKNALAVLAGVVALLTSLLTLYAKYLDIKKSAARESDAAGAANAATLPPESNPPAVGMDQPRAIPERHAPVFEDLAAVDRARQAMRTPAITLIAVGLITFSSNLLLAGFGYVDRFVTPLTTESKDKRAFMESMRENPALAPPVASVNSEASEDLTAVLTVFLLVSLSVASAAAVWAGYGMLHLRSYWLSVAGSFAIMAGGMFCCFAGVPIGIWSLSVLYQPEVAKAFR